MSPMRHIKHGQRDTKKAKRKVLRTLSDVVDQRKRGSRRIKKRNTISKNKKQSSDEYGLYDTESDASKDVCRSYKHLKKKRRVVSSLNQSFIKSTIEKDCLEDDNDCIDEKPLFGKNRGNSDSSYQSLESCESLNDSMSVNHFIEDTRIDQDMNTSDTVSLSKGFTFPDDAIIIPRKHNNKHIHLASNYSASPDNLKLHSKIVSRKASVNYYRCANKNQFVIDFIITNFEGYVVYVFDKQQNKYIIIDELSLNEQIKKRFITLKGKFYWRKKKEKKRDKDIDFDPHEDDTDFFWDFKKYSGVTSDTSYNSYYYGCKQLPGYSNWD